MFLRTYSDRLRYHNDQQHLLFSSPSMSPSGLSSGNPTPLKPLYEHEEESSTGYQHKGIFEDHENIKVASDEDAVRSQS
jgi:hypothetical protein